MSGCSFRDPEIHKKAVARSITPEARAKSSATRKENARIKTEMQSALRELLLKETKGKTYYKEFIEKSLAVAKRDPNSQMAKMLGESVFTKSMWDDLDLSLDIQQNRDRGFLTYLNRKGLFDKQVQVYDDEHVRKKIILCSRRAGKSYLNTSLLIKTCLKPESPCLYLNITFSMAIKQAFDLCVEKAEKIGLKIVKKSKTDGSIEFANGSYILFRGNNDKASADKLRGFKFRNIIIDEAFHQHNVQYLLEDVIEPAMIDFEDSLLTLTGTPPKIKGNFGETIWNNKNSEFKKYHWTLTDNEYLPNHKNLLNEICKKKNMTVTDPLIMREYMGLFSYDTEALVFKKPTTYVVNKQEPDYKLDGIVIGIDFGFVDSNAIISVGYNIEKKQAWIMKEDKFNKSTVSEIINVARTHYNEAKEKVNKVEVFGDPSDKSIIYELSKTYSIPAFNAYKHNKILGLEQLSEELNLGNWVIPKNGILAKEMEMTLYKRDDEDNIIPELDDKVFHPDAIFALLYASRTVFHYFNMNGGGLSKEKVDDEKSNTRPPTSLSNNNNDDEGETFYY